MMMVAVVADDGCYRADDGCHRTAVGCWLIVMSDVLEGYLLGLGSRSLLVDSSSSSS